jgi:effector-binding domain-containing protein
MLETPTIVDAKGQPAAVIALRIPRAEIQKVMGPAIGEVMAAVSSQGIGPVGAVFSNHFKMSPDVFDFEVGVPVRSGVKPVGRVKAGKLPGGRALRAIYSGPYEGLGAAWGEFCGWVKERGHKTGPGLWECYLAGPESGPDPAKWRTELNLPLTE